MRTDIKSECPVRVLRVEALDWCRCPQHILFRRGYPDQVKNECPVRDLRPRHSVVGVSGFEPEASWSRTKRDTKLRHTP